MKAVQWLDAVKTAECLPWNGSSQESPKGARLRWKKLTRTCRLGTVKYLEYGIVDMMLCLCFVQTVNVQVHMYGAIIVYDAVELLIVSTEMSNATREHISDKVGVKCLR